MNTNDELIRKAEILSARCTISLKKTFEINFLHSEECCVDCLLMLAHYRSRFAESFTLHGRWTKRRRGKKEAKSLVKTGTKFNVEHRFKKQKWKVLFSWKIMIKTNPENESSLARFSPTARSVEPTDTSKSFRWIIYSTMRVIKTKVPLRSLQRDWATMKCANL